MTARLHGCNGRPERQDMVLVQDGWNVAGGTRTAVMVERPDPMSKDCQHSANEPTDPGCAGCRWRAS